MNLLVTKFGSQARRTFPSVLKTNRSPMSLLRLAVEGKDSTRIGRVIPRPTLKIAVFRIPEHSDVSRASIGPG